jgi:hypothetical protein
MQGDKKYGTKLAADQEKKYQQWKTRLPKNLQYEGDYDLRGLWKENPNTQPSGNLHFPDKYKLPNHPTFSDESIYFNQNTKDKGGHWQETDSSWNYIPFNKKVKDTMIERKSALQKPPGKDQPVIDWMASYVNSPKYKQRLANFYEYPGYIQNQRANVLRGTKITETPSGSTQYYSSGNEVTVSQPQLDRLKAGRAEALTHELGHAVNKNTENKAAALSLPESRFIMQRNKGLAPDVTKSLLQLAKESGRPLSRLMGGEMHDYVPSENKSDIDAFRFLLKQRKIYDAGTQDATEDILERAKKDPVIRKSFIYKRLKESFEDKDLLDIMNKVAISKNKKQSNIA